ncbi:MAG: OmpH family outer membrane protein [Trueperaceae bacterium]
MKKVPMIQTALFMVFLLTFSLVSFGEAQEKPLKIALISKPALLAAHPEGQKAADLASARDEELQPLIDELQTLQTKAQTVELSVEERSRATLLVQTVEQTRNRYAVDIQTAAAPAETAINEAIAAVSEANGYTLVIDGDLAGFDQLGLFVFVDAAAIPDITEQVVAQMNGQ